MSDAVSRKAIVEGISRLGTINPELRGAYGIVQKMVDSLPSLPEGAAEGRYREALEKIEEKRVEPYREHWERLNEIGDIARQALSHSGEQPDTEHRDTRRLKAIEQAIREFDPIGDYSAQALINWIESVTSFEYEPEKADHA